MHISSTLIWHIFTLFELTVSRVAWNEISFTQLTMKPLNRSSKINITHYLFLTVQELLKRFFTFLQSYGNMTFSGSIKIRLQAQVTRRKY